MASATRTNWWCGFSFTQTNDDDVDLGYDDDDDDDDDGRRTEANSKVGR